VTAPANRRVVLARVPDGVPVAGDFRLAGTEIPEPGPGEFVSRTLWLSLDPYVRGVISGRHISADKVGVGDVVVGSTVSEVVASRHPDYLPGMLVVDRNGWQEYGVSDGEGVRVLPADGAPPSLALGILGMPGLTAWSGLKFLARPHAGETVVVSAAAGPVGSMVGQIARLHGARAVGIAGSREKCDLVIGAFGFDACIDYRNEDLRERLAATCPDGIDVYFDNVAGDTLAAALGRLAFGARIVLCGMIDQYNRSGEPPPGPNLGPVIAARAHIHGLVVYDYYERQDDFLAEATPWYRDGLIRAREDVAEGLENAPAAFCRLMRGENVGKALVRVAEAA